MRNSKVKKLDFVIENRKHDDEHKQIIFRFCPTESHCHSFDDDPPKSWDEVYKVYYSYHIFERYDWLDFHCSDLVFNMPCDECSILTSLAFYIRDLVKTGKSKTSAITFGQPGSEWIIERTSHNAYKFTVWEDPSNKGYRFWLPADRMEEFAEYLDTVNEYMLQHGEPI